MDSAQQPMIQQAHAEASYYPPNGTTRGPVLGPQMNVRPDGTVRLPLVGRIKVTGLTLDEATDQIIQQYRQKEVILPERERILVSLVKPRVNRVMVIREDMPIINQTSLLKPALLFPKHGRAQVVDLPAYENDVLHALTHTNGLPGIDAKSEAWVIRRGMSEGKLEALQARLDDETALAELKQCSEYVRIPLRVNPGEPLGFGPEDVILNDGDVLLVPSRHDEMFYTGGLLLGGEIPLPRDKDLDIVEAMALVGGSVSSPGGQAGAFLRTGGPTNLIPPTRGIVVRKLPDGELLAISVDLNRALTDPVERVIIQPDDMVMLLYTPRELVGNMLLSFVNFTFLIPTSSVR
jgi:hypothetical protein